MNTNRLIAMVPLVAALAACSGKSHNTASDQPAQVQASNSTSASSAPSSSGTTTCDTSSLSVKLGSAGGAAGSTYQPLVFTNTGSSTCTLFGYPGVAFVAPDKSTQVGSAASRNTQHSPATVTLAAGASAAAIVQMAETGNYDASTCKPVDVGGLRVYPPGDTAAMYVAFQQKQTACSADVNQLSVEAVVAGTTGM